jgi:serine/threonine protein kinase
MDMNMYEAIKGRKHYLPELSVKNYMYQLLKAIDHMHRNAIFHRDIKPYSLKKGELACCRRTDETGGFWFMPRNLLKTAIHRIYIY